MIISSLFLALKPQNTKRMMIEINQTKKKRLEKLFFLENNFSNKQNVKNINKINNY